jgi:hypothetical protein
VGSVEVDTASIVAPIVVGVPAIRPWRCGVRPVAEVKHRANAAGREPPNAEHDRKAAGRGSLPAASRAEGQVATDPGNGRRDRNRESAGEAASAVTVVGGDGDQDAVANARTVVGQRRTR